MPEDNIIGLKEVYDELRKLSDSVGELRSEMKSDQADLRTDVAKLQVENENLKADVVDLKDEREREHESRTKMRIAVIGAFASAVLFPGTVTALQLTGKG